MGNCPLCCPAVRAFFTRRRYEEFRDILSETESFQQQTEKNSSDFCQPITADENSRVKTETTVAINIKHTSGTDCKDDENSLITTPSDNQLTKIKELFKQYKHPNASAVYAQGIDRLCNDLGVRPKGYRLLILAWKLNAVQGPCIYEDAFYTGCQNLKAYSIEDIRAKLTDMRKEVTPIEENFRDFYRFAYRFNLKLGHRKLEKGDAIDLWRLVYNVIEPAVLEDWVAYLQSNHSVRTVSRRTWNKFQELAFKDFSCLRNDPAAPLPRVLTDFAEYMRNRVHPSNTNLSLNENRIFCAPETAYIENERSSPSKNYSMIVKLFEQYKDPNEEAILFEKLCADLNIQPEDFRVLLLAWKFNAKRKFCLTREEFVSGCYRMKVFHIQHIQHIQTKLPDVIHEIRAPEKFKDFYRFTFRFGLEPGHRGLDAEQAVRLWNLVFSLDEPPILDRWLKFLIRNPQQNISRDTWNVFLDFTEFTKRPLFRYNPNAAWPVLIDEFMEYEQRNQNAVPSKENV